MSIGPANGYAVSVEHDRINEPLRQRRAGGSRSRSDMSQAIIGLSFKPKANLSPILERTAVASSSVHTRHNIGDGTITDRDTLVYFTQTRRVTKLDGLRFHRSRDRA